MLAHLKTNRYYFKEILAFLFLLFAFYFFRQQRVEIGQMRSVLLTSNMYFVLLGVIVTILYILLQALMYIFSFRAVNSRISLAEALRLFLKRNLVSVFLPGGGVTSLAFFNEDLEHKGIPKSHIGFASYIFGMAGFASLALVALPVVIYLSVTKRGADETWIALIIIFTVVFLLLLLTFSFFKRGWIFNALYRFSPQIESLYEDISSGRYSSKMVLWTLICSVGVEVSGIFHLYIAMLALGIPAQLEVCIAGYTIATLFFAISPFLRGLGAVEVSLIYVLQSYGIDSVASLSVTLLYRGFEFWLPILAGVGVFLFVKGNVMLRILPGLLFAILGLVNIISVLTPPLKDRLQILQQFLPLDLIHFSNTAVLIIGVLILCCSAFLFRGFKNAWWLAVSLAILSLIGNISKGVDYEEAALALFTLIVLFATEKNYRVKGDAQLQNFGVVTASIILISVLIYGVFGFYYLDKRDFGIDFSWQKAVVSTLRSFVLIDPDPVPLTRFAKGFIYSINLLGVMSIGLLVYVFIKPFVFKYRTHVKEKNMADALLVKYGRTADDYFKTYTDKLLFFSETQQGFIAYKISSGFAVALGEPVCQDDPKIITTLINEFEAFCFSNNLKAVYYKVAEERRNIFQTIGKKALPIGLEAVVDVRAFTLEGKDRKSLRNSVNTLLKKGYKSHSYTPPIKDGLLQKLEFVSDDWKNFMKRKEILFSSGMFDWQELKNQEIITIENEDEKVVGFLNIIPDYAPNEVTYDLIRRTKDAPAGVMDALIVALIEELKMKNIHYLNMGMAAMSGIERPNDLPEWTIKFAYEKLKQFKHYQGLYEFKDKFSPKWTAKYMLYDSYYDLTSLPIVLARITKE